MNRVMVTRSVTLHDEHTAATRQRILDAVVELIVHEHPATLSIPAVAAQAGVSVRTVYRHFPTKQALMDAVANLGDEQTAARFPEGASLANLREFFTNLWSEVIHTKALVRAQQFTPVGQEITAARARRRIEGTRRALHEAGIELDDESERRVVAMISLLLSRTTLFELTDVYDLTVEESARLAVWTVEAIVESTQSTKEVGR
jgi:AcrR family transcriptional regulator